MLVRLPVNRVRFSRFFVMLSILFGLATSTSVNANAWLSIGLGYRYDSSQSGPQYADEYKTGQIFLGKRSRCSQNAGLNYYQIFGENATIVDRVRNEVTININPIEETLTNSSGDIMRIKIHPLGVSRAIFGIRNTIFNGMVLDPFGGDYCYGRFLSTDAYLEYPLGAGNSNSSTRSFYVSSVQVPTTQNQGVGGLWRFEVLNGRDLPPGVYTKVTNNVGIKRVVGPGSLMLSDVDMTLSITVDPVFSFSMPSTSLNLDYDNTIRTFSGSLPFTINTNDDYRIKVQHSNSNGYFANNSLMPIATSIFLEGAGLNGSDIRQRFTGAGGELVVAKSDGFGMQAGSLEIKVDVGRGVEPGLYSDQVTMIVERDF